MRNTTTLGLLLLLAACSNLPGEEKGQSQGAGLSAAGSPIIGIGGKCVDVYAADSTNGTKIELWDCNGGGNQTWSFSGGQLVGLAGKCLDVAGNVQADGTRVQLYDCNGTTAQQWTRDGNNWKSASGRCLDATGASSDNGTQLIIWPCNGGPNQSWSYSAGAPTAPAPSTGGGGRPAALAGAEYGGWKITFQDEFDTADTITASSSYEAGKLWYNGTDQCCMSDSTGLGGVMYPTPVNGAPVNPYSVSNGVLDLTLSKKDNVWTSGVMTSVDNAGKGFSQQYGYFEMRARFPKGPGTWPGFWMLDERNKLTGQTGGEIDIIEQYGQFPHGFCTTLHDWAANTAPFYTCGDSPTSPATSQPIDFTDGFHTIGMLWTATTMTFYVDDIMASTTTTPAIMQQPYYLLVDLGIGGGWPTDQTPDPSIMQVDYVRAWGP